MSRAVCYPLHLWIRLVQRFERRYEIGGRNTVQARVGHWPRARWLRVAPQT